MLPMRDVRTDGRTSEDRATQILIWDTLSLAIVQFCQILQNYQSSLKEQFIFVKFCKCKTIKVLWKRGSYWPFCSSPIFRPTQSEGPHLQQQQKSPTIKISKSQMLTEVEQSHKYVAQISGSQMIRAKVLKAKQLSISALSVLSALFVLSTLSALPLPLPLKTFKHLFRFFNLLVLMVQMNEIIFIF